MNCEIHVEYLSCYSLQLSTSKAPHPVKKKKREREETA